MGSPFGLEHLVDRGNRAFNQVLVNGRIEQLSGD